MSRGYPMQATVRACIWIESSNATDLDDSSVVHLAILMQHGETKLAVSARLTPVTALPEVG